MEEQNCALTLSSAPDFLTVEEAASLVRIPRNGMYKAVAAGLVPSKNFGKRRIRIAKVELAKVFQVSLGEQAVTAAFSPSEA